MVVASLHYKADVSSERRCYGVDRGNDGVLRRSEVVYSNSASITASIFVLRGKLCHASAKLNVMRNKRRRGMKELGE